MLNFKQKPIIKKKKMKYKFKILLLIIVLGVISCHKDKPKPNESSTTAETVYSNGILCMNEGLFQQNNANLTFYSLDSNKAISHVFQAINGRGLGDTANDMIEYTYNGKKYIAIAVDISSQIEIIDGETFKSVKQIPMFNGTASREPRALQFYNNKLYSINFDGTVSVIDLSTYSVTQNITCGLNPDNAVVINNKMYVVNSGGLNYPVYDSTLSVIDLSNNLVVDTITTAINCSQIVTDAEGDIYVISRGNYSNIQPKLQRISSTTNLVVEDFNFPTYEMTYYNNKIYYYNDSDNKIYTFNTQTESIEGVLIDCSNYQNVYGIQIDENKQLIYVNDANGYTNSSTVRCYGMNGVFKYEFNTDLNTGKLVFFD
jgi:YVTN family beta-propeller protein